MKKPTPAQRNALLRIALFPAGNFYQQFPGGACARMRGNLVVNGWATFEWPEDTGNGDPISTGGYRLTDSGRALVASWT